MMKQQIFTIGVGIWRELAEFSARRFGEINGCEVTVLGKPALRRFPVTHPSWLKLFLFELCEPDVEEVFLFDADIWAMWPCLVELSCRAQGAGVSLLAVPDRIETRYVQSEALLYGIPPAHYFNCGLLWMNRGAAPALTRARGRHPSYGSWLEQTALNAAVHETGTRYALVDGRYNRQVPVTGGEVGDDAVNLHFAGWKDPHGILRTMREMAGS